MSKQFERNELKVVLAWFKENFPKAFPGRVKDIKPLQLGIMDEIIDFYDRLYYPPFSRKKLRAGLNYYTSSPAYLKAQVEGAMRVNLFGFDDEAVSASQAEYAKERLEQYKSNKNVSNEQAVEQGVSQEKEPVVSDESKQAAEQS